ncbi:MAG: hypothetical protein ACM3MK_02145 [Chitinophagales bacterium]
MSFDNVLASLHLGAVLPLLQDVVEYDGEARQLVKDWDFVVQFQLPGGNPSTALVFQKGKLTTQPGPYQGSKVTLTFKTPAFLNEVFQGKTTKQPSPNLNALFHVKELKQVDQLTGKLEYYLKPSEELLKNPEIFAFCVRMNLYAVAFGIKYVAENDPEMLPVAHHMPDGVVELRVLNGPAAHIKVEHGRFTSCRGPVQNPNAFLELKDVQTAWALFSGNLDLFAAVGCGDIKLRGFIPLLDGVSPLMDRLTLYLGS